MKVKYLPYQPHCFAFGGFELQMLGALDAVRKSGVDAEKMDIWSRDNNFDILHCWGLGFHHYDNMTWGRNARKKVVLTALLSYYESYYERLRHFLSTYIKKAQYLIYIANLADAVVVVNELQAEACHRYFKVPEKKISIIPNIVHQKYFDNKPNDIFSRTHNTAGYVLTVGSVCRRKNQLSLVRACKQQKVKLVIIGKLIEGDESYGAQIESEIQDNADIIWIKGLTPNSEELASAYQSCAMVALPSFVEQQPITLLEAVATRRPMLIADRAYANQKYYTQGKTVDPDSVDSIARGISTIKANPPAYISPLSAIEECHEESVGTHYRKVYEQVLRQ